MGFNKEQLDAMGAISLDEFAACLAVALAPARVATECTLAPLTPALLLSTEMPALLSELSHDKKKLRVATPFAVSAAGGALASSNSPAKLRTRLPEGSITAPAPT